MVSIYKYRMNGKVRCNQAKRQMQCTKGRHTATEMKGGWGTKERQWVEELENSLSSSPGFAEWSQLGPNAPGKHQEPATPNVTLCTLLRFEVASQFPWQDMTFHLVWQWRKRCDSRLLIHTWGIPLVQARGCGCFHKTGKSLQIWSDAKEQEAAGGKLS